MAACCTLRAITNGDIETIAANVGDAFAAYRSFAPPGWEPPRAAREAQNLRLWIQCGDRWGEVAIECERIVGHVTTSPASSHSFRPEPEESLMHLGHLFLRPSHHGSGLARRLLADAAAAGGARGFTEVRLFAPEGQARARRFYVREGFALVGEPFDPGFGLPLVEYRLALPPPAAS
jgi:GNAT superfamily N-acetyltransferase